ncbi:MAG: hypothetical protein J5J00_12350 [Deltaproteobacteria bacterium]|nr:hypothetical protein [Deltaproteobacteria bacterium]
MKGGSLTILFAAALCLLPMVAIAQPTNVFEKMDWKMREQVYKSPLSNAYSPDPNSRRYEASPEGYRSMQLCDGKGCGGAIELEDLLPRLQPDKRRHGVNIYGPMSGFSDTMYSKMHAQQLSSIMASPVVLYNTTMMLVEPAVASGVQNSAMFGLNSIQSRYLAEMTFMDSLDSQPDTKEIVLRMYNECVADSIRYRDRVADADAKKDAISWIEAQSRCMADRLKNVHEVWGGANFDKIGSSTSGDGTGIGFSFWNDTAHKSWLAGSGSADREIITLTDYVFNESNIDDLKISAGELNGVKKNFQELFGDYEFTVDKQEAGNRSSSREIKYKKISPTIPFEKLYFNRFTEIFKKIMTMVEKQCKYTPPGAQPFEPSNLYCTKGGQVGDINEFVAVSTHGYQFDCAMLAMLWQRFAADFPEIESKQCGKLNPSGESDPATLFDNHKKIKTGHRAVAFLASKIALAQIYSTAMHVNSVLNNMASHGGFNGYVKLYGSQLIYSAIGSDNYMADYVSIMDSINDKFRPEMQNVTAIDSGKGAGKLGDAIAEDKAQQGTARANPS